MATPPRRKGRPKSFDSKAQPTIQSLERALDALDALAGEQPLFERTRSVHAAAIVDMDGSLVLVREDVGRHNALDKLVGASLRMDIEAGNRFVVMTSRCSYELVQKSARFGVGTLVTISAPTSRALALARELNMVLATRGADGEILFLESGGAPNGQG